MAMPKLNEVSWDVVWSMFVDWSSAEIDVLHSMLTLPCGWVNVSHSTLYMAWPSVDACG